MAHLAYALFHHAFILVATAIGIYGLLLAFLTTATFQSHVVYLHAIKIPWFEDLNIPENFGFLKNQVTPFAISTADGERLYAWHILPLELYRKNEFYLVDEPSGFITNITSRTSFKLLREDPEARLVIHMHGAGGTVGSGYRVANYRALSAGHPEKIHILTFDYRGFGKSSGSPCEAGLVNDGLAVVEWAINVAGVSPSRIVIFGQSMGTAVSIAVSKNLAFRDEPIVLAGTILVAPFVDIATLVSTYRVAGIIPILSPIASFPSLFEYLKLFIHDRWLNKDAIAEYIRINEANEKKYRLIIIHAEDDYDIPWRHSQLLVQHAVYASVPAEVSFEETEDQISQLEVDLGAGGSKMEWKSHNGIIKKMILRKGLHDVIMGYPIISMTVIGIFAESDSLLTY